MSANGQDLVDNGFQPEHPALALLRRETQMRRGRVARELEGSPVPDGTWALGSDSILLRADDGIGLFYRRGEGITVDAPPGADPRDIDLWVKGTVYAAAAAFNGLLPFHASAVEYRGKAYAFSAPPGGGKSTLAAALGRHGLPLLCDDTLILDISAEGPVTALPGHKRLKLSQEASALAGAETREEVATHYHKFFAEPPCGAINVPLPLAALIFLDAGEEPQLSEIAAGERIARLQDDHYTAQLFTGASGLTRAARFAQLSNLARRIPMRRFRRPFEPSRFAEGVTFLADTLRAAASP